MQKHTFGAALQTRKTHGVQIVNGRIVLSIENPAHLYEMSVEWSHPIRGTQSMKIDVHANTRSQAGSLAKRNGYKILDCNMAG